MNQNLCSTQKWLQLGLAVTLGVAMILSLAMILGLTRPGLAYAAGTITVTGTGDTVDGADGFCTLREAIQAANTDLAVNECSQGSGVDTIVFTPTLANQTIVLTGGQLAITSAMTIDGADALTLTVSGDGASRVFYINGTGIEGHIANLIVANGNIGGTGGGIYAENGLTLTNVSLLSNTSTNSGGGAYAATALTITGGLFENNHCTGASSGGGAGTNGNLTINDTRFISNTSDSNGGGAWSDGTIVINGAYFEANQASNDGGGLASFGGQPVLISGTTFISNTASNKNGGGVKVNGATTLTSTNFISNTASNKNGGGLYVAGVGGVRLTGGRFERNMAQAKGGGLYVSGKLTLNGTEFISNTAATDGGGVYHSASNGLLVNALLAGNRAGGNGAGLYLGSFSAVEVLNTTIAGPSLNAKQAIYVGNGTVDIINSIIVSHTVGIEQAGGTVYQDYNLFFSNTTNLTGTITSGGHSRDGDPKFANLASDDYHLQLASPAINAGDNSAVSSVTTDLDGNPRIVGGTVDMGAYEFEFPPSYIITPTVGTGGSIAPAAPQTVNHNDSITFTVTPTTGYHITDVLVDGVSKGAIEDYTFHNVTANHSISAAFAINTYIITPTAGTGGSITPATPQAVNHNDSITFTVTSTTGYHITDVLVDGVSKGAIEVYTFHNVTATHSISAAFAINTYIITPTAGTGGSITPATPQTIYHGGEITFTITPMDGYDIADIFVDGVSQGAAAGYTFTNVTANYSISATFSEQTMYIYLPVIMRN